SCAAMPSASAPRTNPRPLKTDFRLLRKDEMQTPCPVVAVLLASAQADKAIPAPGRRVLLASPPRLRWRRHRPRAPPLSSCADQSAEATPRCGSTSGVCPSGDIHLRAQRTWLCRRVAEHLDLHRAAAAIAADDRRRALGERDQLGILRRGVRQRPPGP